MSFSELGKWISAQDASAVVLSGIGLLVVAVVLAIVVTSCFKGQPKASQEPPK